MPPFVVQIRRESTLIQFFSLIDGGHPPVPADKSALGTLPTDGFRYCEPVRTASSFGWYVFLPFSLWLTFSGYEMRFSLDEGDTWYPLDDAVQYPGFRNSFDESAPERIRGYAPPFLARTADRDILQVWTGNVARTREGIHSYVRGPVNLRRSDSYEVMEGVIQTDWWFGPLFTNIRLLKTDVPIFLNKDAPFIQVQPVSAELTRDKALTEAPVSRGLDSFGEAEWQAYADTVVRRMETRQRLGDYAVEARRKGKSADPQT